MDNRVFWSVLCALLVFSGLVAAGTAMLFAAQREAVSQAQQQTQQRIQAIAQQGLQEVQASARQRAAYAQWLRSRERLLPGQRCVGGVVVQVQANAYTQVGYPGHPAHCEGDYADQPMR
jgi:hypothetical protein